MTISIAVIGKSGSGKTTLAKSILTALHEHYANKSILLVDNDLNCELGYTFGVDVKDTIYDIRAGKYGYKTRIPEGMSKYEFIEWALQDILINVYDDIDLIASGPVSTKNCNCFIAGQINDALVKLFKAYDIVIFDCEYDLEYLHQLVDYPVDVTLVVTDCSITSIYSSSKIKQSSVKLAIPGQLGVVLNKVKGQIPDNISKMLTEYDLDVLGTLPYDEALEHDSIKKDSPKLVDATKELLFRLNLPQM